MMKCCDLDYTDDVVCLLESVERVKHVLKRLMKDVSSLSMPRTFTV